MFTDTLVTVQSDDKRKNGVCPHTVGEMFVDMTKDNVIIKGVVVPPPFELTTLTSLDKHVETDGDVVLLSRSDARSSTTSYRIEQVNTTWWYLEVFTPTLCFAIRVGEAKPSDFRRASPNHLPQPSPLECCRMVLIGDFPQRVVEHGNVVGKIRNQKVPDAFKTVYGKLLVATGAAGVLKACVDTYLTTKHKPHVTDGFCYMLINSQYDWFDSKWAEHKSASHNQYAVRYAKTKEQEFYDVVCKFKDLQRDLVNSESPQQACVILSAYVKQLPFHTLVSEFYNTFFEDIDVSCMSFSIRVSSLADMFALLGVKSFRSHMSFHRCTLEPMDFVEASHAIELPNRLTAPLLLSLAPHCVLRYDGRVATFHRTEPASCSCCGKKSLPHWVLDSALQFLVGVDTVCVFCVAAAINDQHDVQSVLVTDTELSLTVGDYSLKLELNAYRHCVCRQMVNISSVCVNRFDFNHNTIVSCEVVPVPLNSHIYIWTSSSLDAAFFRSLFSSTAYVWGVSENETLVAVAASNSSYDNFLVASTLQKEGNLSLLEACDITKLPRSQSSFESDGICVEGCCFLDSQSITSESMLIQMILHSCIHQPLGHGFWYHLIATHKVCFVPTEVTAKDKLQSVEWKYKEVFTVGFLFSSQTFVNVIKTKQLKVSKKRTKQRNKRKRREIEHCMCSNFDLPHDKQKAYDIVELQWKNAPCNQKPMYAQLRNHLYFDHILNDRSKNCGSC